MIKISSNKLLRCTFPTKYYAEKTGCCGNINNLLLPYYGLLSTSSSTPSYVVSNNRWSIRRPRLQTLSNRKVSSHHQTLYKSCDHYLTSTSRFIPTTLLKYNYREYTNLHSSRSLSNQNISKESDINMAKIISGKEVSDEIRAKLKAKVETMSIKPKLAIVQVGGREDSNVYIRMKIQFAESIGASAELIKLSRDVSENELAKKVEELNQDRSVHGIITQLPFDCSQKIDSDRIVNLISPSKDVDGLCVYNAGKLLHGELNSNSFVPCTPNGCMELIRKSGITLEGTRSVVIGRSKIVGSPMAQLLVWHNSTVTICHSRTKNLEEICGQADIIVAAVGRAQMVKKSWVKPGAVVIDCGINVIPDASKKSGTRLVGDVDYDDCKEVAGAITPVPGGVGPMTVAMLISNTVESASRMEK